MNSFLCSTREEKDLLSARFFFFGFVDNCKVRCFL